MISSKRIIVSPPFLVPRHLRGHFSVAGGKSSQHLRSINGLVPPGEPIQESKVVPMKFIGVSCKSSLKPIHSMIWTCSVRMVRFYEDLMGISWGLTKVIHQLSRMNVCSYMCRLFCQMFKYKMSHKEFNINVLMSTSRASLKHSTSIRFIHRL